MKRLLETKLSIVLLACSGLIALALLSSVLRDFTFQPSQPFSLNLFGGGSPLIQAGPSLEIPFWKYVFFASLLLVICVLIIVLADAETRKRLLLKLFRIIMMGIAVFMLINYAYERGSLRQLIFPSLGAGGGTTPATQMNIPAYVQPQISPWLVLAVSFGVVLVLILVGWFLYTRRPRPQTAHTLEEIAGIAREALSGLQSGGDWDEAIVRAYIRMSDVVTSERGLIRQPATTPSEFARRMEHAGLPTEAVHSLTRLFEAARYGAKRASPADRDLAAAALSAILHACGVNS